MSLSNQLRAVCEEIEKQVLQEFPTARRVNHAEYGWDLGHEVTLILMWEVAMPTVPAYRTRTIFSKVFPASSSHGEIASCVPTIVVTAPHLIGWRRYSKSWEYKDAVHLRHIFRIAHKKIAEVKVIIEERLRLREEAQSLYAQQKIELAGVTLPAGMFATRMPDGQYLVRLTTTMSLTQLRELAALLQPRCTVSTEEVSS